MGLTAKSIADELRKERYDLKNLQAVVDHPSDIHPVEIESIQLDKEHSQVHFVCVGFDPEPGSDADGEENES